MMEKTWKIFLVCCAGAGIGSLVALELNHNFWWVGLIVGALVGYLSYQWREVIAAIPAAYRAARKIKINQGIGLYLLIQITAISWLLIIRLGFDQLSSAEKLPDYTLMFAMCAGIAWMTLMLCCLTHPLELLGDYLSGISTALARMRKIAALVFPPTAVLLLIVFFARSIIFFVKNFKMIAKEVGYVFVAIYVFFSTFLWEFFVLVHSQERVICALDSALGAAIGYFAGSAIIGAVAGGILGVVNYTVVTKLWLEPNGYIKRE